MDCSVDGCPKDARPYRKGWCESHYKRWWRHGDPLAGRTPEGLHVGCMVEGCEKPHDTGGYCIVHYMRVKRFGDPGPAGKIKGSDHRHWKGDDITYSSAHWRVEELRGLASEWGCAHCAVPAEGWAYTHHAENEKVSPEGWAYSTDPDDYTPLCQSCHKTMDMALV